MFNENNADREAKTRIKSFRVKYVYFTFSYSHSLYILWTNYRYI